MTRVVKLPKPWIGVDLDGTIAEYTEWKGPLHIGRPIPEMCKRVLQWLANGETVKIFTARCSDPDPRVVPTIKKWCKKQFGVELEVTNVKDFQMIELYDDRALAVEQNTGRILGGNSRL